MGGKHRKSNRPDRGRRQLLALMVGGTAAAGVTVATSGTLYRVDELKRVIEGTPQPPVDVSRAAPPATSTTAAPPSSSTVTPAASTTTPKTPSLSDELAEQPRSGWGLLPSAAASAHLIALTFGIKTVGGFRASSEIAGSDHPKRLAADFMTSNQTINRAVGNFAIANRKLLRVKYAISLQHYNDGSGWVLMENRGSSTANHFDHCHVSFY